LVSLFLVAVLFSCTTMVTMSPTANALRSATIDGANGCRHSESACAGAAISAAPTATSQRNRNRAFILHLSAKFVVRLDITHAHLLSHRPVFQHFHLQ